MAAAGIVISAGFWVFLNTCSSTLGVPVGIDVIDDFCACGVLSDLTNCK
jgi:hypothetical protein